MTQIQNSTPPWPTMVDDDGSGKTGTKGLKTTFWDVIRDSINFLIHSTTNPTVTPAAITDEVITARGSVGSLDGRLDVALNEDGTLKTQTGYLSPTTYQDGLGARNLAYNGDFNDWENGAAAAPDGFTLTGAGATVARIATMGCGDYACRLTRAGANVLLQQIVISVAEWAQYEKMEGRKVAVTILGDCSGASRLRLGVDDGAAKTTVYHDGSGLPKVMTVVHTISATATYLYVDIEMMNGNLSGDFGGLQVMMADLAPTAWQPKSREPVATADRSGIVSIAAQMFGGLKTFRVPAIFWPGASSTGTDDRAGPATISGRLTGTGTEIQDRTNSGTGETDAGSFTLKGNSLNADGKILRVTMWGVCAANANLKSIKAYFGTASIVVAAPVTFGAVSDAWEVVFEVIRTGAATQVLKSVITGWVDIRVRLGTGAIAHNADQTVKFTLQSDTAGGDITEKGYYAEVIG